MDRPDLATVPAQPGLARVVRRALGDLWSHLVVLVLANAALVAAVFVMVAAASSVSPLLALALGPLLGLPLAGIFACAAAAARGLTAGPFTIVRAWRHHAVPALLAAGVTTLVGFGFLFYAVLGMELSGLVGWTVVALCAYGVLLLLMATLTFWPLLVDPVRDDLQGRARLRLTLAATFAAPVRLAVLGLLTAVILVLSTAAVVAVLTIAVPAVALLATHFVLPLADRIEGRRTVPPADDEAVDALAQAP